MKGRQDQTVDRRRYAEFDFSRWSFFTEDEFQNLIPVNKKFDNTNPSAIENTIYDARLGYSSYNTLRCATCREKAVLCQGHGGALPVPPLPHPLVTKQIRQLLNISCQSCYLSLLKPAELEKYARLPIEQRLDAVYEDLEQQIKNGSIKCDSPECKPNSIISFDKKGYFYFQEFEKKIKKRAMDGSIIDPYKAYEMLDTLSNDDEMVAFLGFSPIDLMPRYLYVPPPCVRESNTTAESGRTNMDYLGLVYQDLLTKIAAKTTTLALVQDLFNIFSHLINNSDGSYKKSKTPLKGIYQLLKGKKGLIRGNAMGKRTNFSSRSVITPDPEIPIGAVGCPESIMNKQTVPEYICAYNYQHYREVLKAQNEGGPKQITRWAPASNLDDFTKIKDENKDEIYQKLAFGDMITRRLQNMKDITMVGRNPTLHKHGDMSMYTKLVKEDTIRLPPAIVSPYNADFDGDEMNLKTPQDYLARAEAKHVSFLPRLIDNPETGQNIIGLVMDDITGAFIITNVFVEGNKAVSKELFDRAVALLSHKDDLATLDRRLKVHGVKKYTNRGLFSILLPETFNYDITVDGKKIRAIADGVFLQSALKKEHIGRSRNSIIKKCRYLYGWGRGTAFINDGSHVINLYNSVRQFSVGISDCRLEDQRLVDIKTKDNSNIKFAAMTLQVEVESKLEQERLEGEVNAILNRGAELGQKVNQILPASNPIKQMVNSGAKGDFFNISQIIAQLGQQFLQGRRIPLSLTDGQRASIFYPKGSTDPEARGYVINSFSDGLSPSELMFHLMATREGLVDTATKTADVGDLHHRIAKALENYMVEYDGTVRDRSGNIIQFLYGDDGLDPASKVFYGSETNEFGFFGDLELLAEKINSECYLEFHSIE